MRPTANDDSRRDFLQALTALGGAGVGGSLLLSACAEQSTQDGSADENRSRNRAVQQINKIRREWERAENEGDPSIIDRHAADDVIAMPPGRPPVVGAEAGKKSLRKWFNRFDVNIEYTSEEVLVSDEIALDRMTSSSHLVPKGGGEPIETTGSSLWIYRRMPEGWKQILAIWNKNS